MSIFSSLFSRGRDDDDDEEELEYEEEDLSEEPRKPLNSPNGELSVGMRLDVTTPEGAALISGRITGLKGDTLTLERLPGGLAFKICSLDAAVNANGYDRRMMPVSLRADVAESTRIVLKLKNVQVVTHTESREGFRLPITVPVQIYRYEDEHYRSPEECTLVDISTGGACFQSEYLHSEDDVLRLRVKLDDYSPLNFVGQIIRCVEYRPGVFRYGLLFAQLTEEETTTLNRILYNLQTGSKNTHMRTEMGHW